MPDDFKTVGNDAKFEGITEMPVCHYQIYFGNFEKYFPKKAVYMVSYVSEKLLSWVHGL